LIVAEDHPPEGGAHNCNRKTETGTSKIIGPTSIYAEIIYET
jgi:hypothetical protein